MLFEWSRRRTALVFGAALAVTALIGAIAASCFYTAEKRTQLFGVSISPFSRYALNLKGQLMAPDGQVWDIHTAGRPHSLTVGPDYLRFELRPGERWPLDGFTRRSRSEISGLWAPSSGRSTVSYEVKLDGGDLSAKGVQHVIGQRHGKADLADVRGEHPVIAFRILDSGRAALTVAGSPQQPLRTIPKSQYAWRGRAGAFPSGVWHKIVIDSLAGDHGWVDLWIDGRLMRSALSDRHTFEGSLGYANRQPDYWKFGDYCARGVVEPMVVYVRNIRLST